MSDPESHHIDVAPGIAIHVETRGEGVPVVVLHGFTGDTTTMVGLTERLAQFGRVIVPDLIGHGRSSAPQIEGAYSVDSMVSHLLAATSAFEIPMFHLVGYSMGGRVALTAGCRHPDQVMSMTLIGVSAGLATEREQQDRRDADEELAMRIESAGLEQFVDRWMSLDLFATQIRLGDAHFAAARAQRLRNDPVGLARSLREGGSGFMTPLHDQLGRCDVPTTLVAGEDDPKFSAIASQLGSAMPSAEVAVIGRAGHAVHLEQPDAVAALVARHMGGA